MKPTSQENIEAINYLKFMVRTYDGITDLITGTKQRLLQMNPEVNPKNDFLLGGENGTKGLEAVKGALVRRMEKELIHWPLWTQWLKQVPGIGPSFGAKLIVMYYYKFVPVCECGTGLIKQEGTFWCETCQKSSKGEGNTKYKVVERDFPCISSWWKFMGVHCDAEGRKPKRKAGVVCDWSTAGRTLAYLIGTSFMKLSPEKCLYRDFYDARIVKRLKTHPDATKMHRMNMARNEAGRLFLAHMWTVARTLDGKPVSLPYAFTIMGHSEDHYIKPPYFEGVAEKAA